MNFKEKFTDPRSLNTILSACYGYVFLPIACGVVFGDKWASYYITILLVILTLHFDRRGVP
jgi:hypothetical protein